jgi:hypothetical protein
MKPLSFSAWAACHARAATGQLGWAPNAFWQATPAEFLTAWRGFCGVLDAPIGTNTPLTRSELEALLAADAAG